MKKFIYVVMTLLLLMSGCSSNEAPVVESAMEKKGDVTIIYTNDIHSNINNQKKNEDDTITTLLTYSKVAAVKKAYEAEGKNVILADAGDHVQGTAYGSFDEGESMMKLMEATGYDVATIGNHEFDYGMFRFFEIMDKSTVPYVCCNFISLEDNQNVLPAYEIIEKDGVKVAVIGIITPSAIDSSTPTYFQNEKGEYLYDFLADGTGEAIYAKVQETIDEARTKANYVVVLAHTGIANEDIPYTCYDIIHNTTGIDAYIDGHTHSQIEYEEVEDKEGNLVVYTQTGCYLNAIGVMEIHDGEIKTHLITEYEEMDEEVHKVEEEVINSVNEVLGEQIGVLETEMYIYNPEDDKDRIVRRSETNLSDLIADSVYYEFNEALELPCDVTFINGGGVRASIPQGDITYLDVKSAQPFGNVICLIEVTGQQLLDALEANCTTLGTITQEGKLAEPGLLHTSGLIYTIDTSIEFTGKLDENGTYIEAPTSDYRVKDIKIYNKETMQYEAIDLTKTYRVGGINYLLRNGGGGLLEIFKDCKLVIDYVDEDYLTLSKYIQAFEEVDGMPHVVTKNSPLMKYENFLLDYENPYGAGRITIK